MIQLGSGVMIQMLMGADQKTAKVLQGTLGKELASAILSDDNLYLSFTDETSVKIWDNGQSCCECRYMRTDDDLSTFVGGKVVSYDVANAPDVEDGGESHEVQFFRVQTTKGMFVMASHNEHKGYYGGFSIEALDITQKTGA